MRITGTLFSLTNLVDKVSRYHPSAITIAQLVEFGKRRDESASYLFLYREISIRLSHMIKELEMLPDGLREQYAVKQVEGMYWKSCFSTYQIKCTKMYNVHTRSRVSNFKINTFLIRVNE